jgi:hypothetical protein
MFGFEALSVVAFGDFLQTDAVIVVAPEGQLCGTLSVMPYCSGVVTLQPYCSGTVSMGCEE